MGFFNIKNIMKIIKSDHLLPHENTTVNNGFSEYNKIQGQISDRQIVNQV